MWKSVVGHKMADAEAKKVENDEDDWDTDPDFVNTVSEKEQRWGSKTIEGSGRLDSVNIAKLREEVQKDDEFIKQKQLEESPIKPSMGYGGKYGVQHDRKDKSALGFDYQNRQDEKHSSQTNYLNVIKNKYSESKQPEAKSSNTQPKNDEGLSLNQSLQNFSLNSADKHEETNEEPASKEEISKDQSGLSIADKEEEPKQATPSLSNSNQEVKPNDIPTATGKLDFKSLRSRFENK